MPLVAARDFGNRKGLEGIGAASANAFVAAILIHKARCPGKIYYALAIPDSFAYTPEVRISVADHDCLAVLQHWVDVADHQPGNVRDAIQNEIPVGAYQFGYLHVLVIDAQDVTLAGKALDNFNHWAFAQVIRSRLKAETQHTDACMTLLHDEMQPPHHL